MGDVERQPSKASAWALTCSTDWGSFLDRGIFGHRQGERCLDAFALTTMGDSRRVVNYEELWDEASTSSAAPRDKRSGGQPSPLARSNGWSKDGSPNTASSARRLRKILNLLHAGNIELAEAELEKTGSAKNNYEIQRALAQAKKRRAEGGPLGDEGGVDAGEGDEEGAQDEDTDMVGNDFNWQGAMNGNQSDSSRQLTHAEIWDDSALVDAWTAAEEEYKLFHARRSAQEKAKEAGQPGKSATDRPAKRSALWHDSPAKGSPAAVAAKAAVEQQQTANRRELEESKRRARSLLAQVAGEDESVVVAGAPEQAVDGDDGQGKRKKKKGTTPPSSSISGNLAWHSACATVSRTPNTVGPIGSGSDGPGMPTTPAFVEAVTPASQQPTVGQDGQDIFQNLAMAWYYAGYYQAMAANWSATQ